MCVFESMFVTPVMQTEHNTKIQGTGAVQNIRKYSVDIIEHTCKNCHERKWLPKRTVYLQANVRVSGTKAPSGSVLVKKMPISEWNDVHVTVPVNWAKKSKSVFLKVHRSTVRRVIAVNKWLCQNIITPYDSWHQESVPESVDMGQTCAWSMTRYIVWCNNLFSP